MVEEAKNLLIGKSCYECLHFYRNKNICGITFNELPENKTCDNWYLLEYETRIKKAIFDALRLPIKYLTGERNG